MESNISATGNPGPSNPVVVVVQNNGGHTRSEDKEHFKKMFPVKLLSALSAGQIFIFIVALICEIIVITQERYGPRDGTVGIWGGIFFGVAGAVGLLATWRPSQCSIITFMIMSIIAASFCIPVVVFGGIGIGQSKSRLRWKDDEDEKAEIQMVMIFYGLIFFCGFIEALLSIVCAALCCRATCCRVRSTAGTVMYNPNIEAQPNGTISIPLGTTVPPKEPVQDPPPQYQDTVPDEGEKYQRFG